MLFIAGFWLEEKAFRKGSDGPLFQLRPNAGPWIELDSEPLTASAAWDAHEDPPSLFSRKLWLEQQDE